MRILLITHFFPPLNSPASLRMYSFAKYISERWETSVITTRKYGYEGSLDLRLRPPNNVDIFELGYPPFSFLDLFNQVRRKISTRSGEFSYDTRYRKANQLSVVGRVKSILRFLRKNFIGQIPDPRDGWIIPAFLFASKMVKEKRVNVVLSSFGPPSPHIIASLLKYVFPDILWVADYRDLWFGNHIYPSRGPIRILEKTAEDFFVRKADLITTVSEGLGEKLLRFGKKVVVIYNGFDDEVNHTKGEKSYGFPRSRNTEDEIKLVYTGTIYPGTRVPTLLFSALRKIKGSALEKKIKVYFYGNLWGLEDIIKKEKVEEFVIIGGFLNYSTSLKVQSEADILLLVEKSEVKGIITQKVFEYMRAMKPILAVVPPESEVGKIVLQSGLGFIPKDENDIIWFLKNFRRFKPNLKFIKNFSRREQVRKLISEIEEIASHKRRRIIA